MNRIKDEYEHGRCPECNLEIPADAVPYDRCAECGFVFVGDIDDDVIFDEDEDDTRSALASAGFGTDEDYNHFGDE